jgi:hypothetical protein
MDNEIIGYINTEGEVAMHLPKKENIVGYIPAEGYDTPEEAWENSEGWVTCVSHTHERVLSEFAELVDKYLEDHPVYRPKEVLAWVLARYKGMDDMFEITKDMITEGDHNQCYECWSGWTDDLYKQSMKDAVARWENR